MSYTQKKNEQEKVHILKYSLNKKMKNKTVSRKWQLTKNLNQTINSGYLLQAKTKKKQQQRPRY